MAMHVACTADAAYAPHAAAMAHSLLAANRGTDVTLHWLAPPDLPAARRDQLTTSVERGGGRLIFHAVDPASVARLPEIAKIPRVMWHRIFLPELLPDLDRVLYLDADTLVLDSLAPLWEQPLDGAYLAAVSNVLEPRNAARPAELGLPADQRYFNSGVLLLNLARMRADGCTAELVRYARREQLQWPDQDALNVVLGARRVPLHPRWNCMNSLFLLPELRPEAEAVFGRDAVREACADPAIVHFEGPALTKPWHYLSKHPYRDEYFRHRAATPWPVVEPAGRTLPNVLLRPLPTPAAMAVLTRWIHVRNRVRARLGG